MISHSPVYVKPLKDYKLFLRFDNNEERIFDVKPYLKDKYFSLLKNKAIFKTVKTNQLTIEWIGNIDICPDELYYNSKLIEHKK
ncbi:MAG: DUF2442 domain-containing protein [Actinobacteria bacterium]|nr:DUF2442 domain-containing protein [Actinomycetota bacterium]